MKSVELLNLNNLNIFIGKNSSGKSNLLEGLNLFFKSFSFVGGNTAGLNQYHWYNRNTRKPIEFELIFELTEKEISQLIPKKIFAALKKLTNNLPDIYKTISIKRKIINLTGTWETELLDCFGLILVHENKTQTPDNVFQSFRVEYTEKNKILPYDVFVPSNEEINTILSNIVKKIKDQYRLITQIRDVKNPVSDRVTLINSELQTALWTLDQSIQTDEEDKFIDINQSFTNITSKSLDPAQGQAYIRRQGRRFPLYLEGGGVQSAIQLIFEIKNQLDQCVIFGIEEPESHAHSDMQRRIFNELKTLSEKCQLFIATHSPTFVDKDHLKDTWISKIIEGATVFERTNILKTIVEELGIRPSDVLFFADRILFVEGKSDEIILRVFSKILGVDLSNVAIIPIGGKTKSRHNLTLWLKITRGMLPIFLILDKDAESEIEPLEQEGLIKTTEYHIWEEGALESYYPVPVVKKALSELDLKYSLGLPVEQIIKRIQQGKLTPDKIDLGEKTQLLEKTWKVELAKIVANLIITSKDLKINDEVKRALKQALS